MPVVETLSERVGVKMACEALGVPRSTRYAARRPRAPKERAPAPPPPRALSAEEQGQVRETLNSQRFADQAPREVYATLLDEGRYVCSVPTMYRILGENQEIQERRNQLRHPAYAKPELVATGPNQVWSWDTLAPAQVQVSPNFWGRPSACTSTCMCCWICRRSRFVVGWLIGERECAALAEQLIAEACVRQLIGRDQLALHSDRGAPTPALAAQVQV